MIHHLSIPAKNPLHVTSVLVELFGGVLTRFGPYRDSYIAWAGDDYGTAIEVYPVGTDMFPDAGGGQANFRHNVSASPFVATHAAVSVSRSKEEPTRWRTRAVKSLLGGRNLVVSSRSRRRKVNLMRVHAQSSKQVPTMRESLDRAAFQMLRFPKKPLRSQVRWLRTVPR